jgi:hypothetical protein
MSAHAPTIPLVDKQPAVVLGLNVADMMRLHSRYLAREISYEQLSSERAKLLAKQRPEPKKKSA